MIAQILDWLYVGDFDYTEQALLDLKIDHVINVCGEKTGLEDTYLHLNDGPNPMVDYRFLVDVIQQCRDKKMRILVHCRTGMSRSPFIVALWLAQHNGMGIHDAITFVKIKHPVTLPVMDMVMEYLANCEDMKK